MILIKDIITAVLLICIICTIACVIFVLVEDHNRKKQCKHLCSVCKYKYYCDWKESDL